MGSRAMIFMKAPDGWYYKFSQWGASHLVEGIEKEKFWKKGDKNAVKPVFRSVKGYLDGRWKRMGKDETYNFVKNFDIETILMFEKPEKRLPDKATLFVTRVPINDSFPNGGVFVLDKIKSPLGCISSNVGETISYVEGAIHAIVGGEKKVPQHRRKEIISKILSLPYIKFERGFKCWGYVSFIGEHDEYPLDYLFTVGEVIRRDTSKLGQFHTLEEFSRYF